MTGSSNRMSAAVQTCPEARISQPTEVKDGHTVLDIENYVPFFFYTVNGALTSGASNLYRKRYGVGATSWRVVAMLAIEPRITAARICEVIKIDKAACSRTLKFLEEKGFVSFLASPTDERKRRWWLNSAGYKLHDDLLALALVREEKLIEDIDPTDLETFLRVARQMLHNAGQP